MILTRRSLFQLAAGLVVALGRVPEVGKRIPMYFRGTQTDAQGHTWHVWTVAGPPETVHCPEWGGDVVVQRIEPTRVHVRGNWDNVDDPS